ncbi:twin-arginine translocation pathway signal protein [Roseibacterium sp. SDUM158016]|uniref:Acg family FMN-binding oxidoreductase n=1 Tax=Roseicyclus sediminis TaxID=2980997 RepID=UPI0021CFC85D|nr:twin-arginine translocation pathway signal protein [Roseibacterium sp. SDUM158016]MCU4654829.1 twin-arginine translocation pathway signal protein [Roseibacterium sp. SDUM158016]
MTLSRRKTLVLIGGGAVLAATVAVGYDVTRLPRDAMRPWDMAGQYADPRMRALSWAILAPNPHNLQPWKVDLSVRDQVTLFVDTDRLLPQTDPFSRQIVIGLGCFLEVLRMAALADGLEMTSDLFPEGSDPLRVDARPVAVCRFSPTDAAPDPLFAFVPSRRSLKEPYDTSRPVPADALDRIAAATRHFGMGHATEPGLVQEMRDLSTDAIRIEFATERTLRESVELFRIGHREVNANPDGLEFMGPMFETLRVFGLFTREASLDPEGLVARSADAAFVENMQTAMGHIWQVTPTNTRLDQIRAGMDWVRINLAATELGIGMQPLSQALQEYPEMSELYDEIHRRLAPEGGTVQMWARVGYGPEILATPRWPLEAKIVGGTG